MNGESFAEKSFGIDLYRLKTKLLGLACAEADNHEPRARELRGVIIADSRVQALGLDLGVDEPWANEAWPQLWSVAGA